MRLLKIVLAQQPRHDFGPLAINGGTVETVFRISNEGSASVRLVSVTTSYGCTSVVVEFTDGSKAGPFGMPATGYKHGSNGR